MPYGVDIKAYDAIIDGSVQEAFRQLGLIFFTRLITVEIEQEMENE